MMIKVGDTVTVVATVTTIERKEVLGRYFRVNDPADVKHEAILKLADDTTIRLDTSHLKKRRK